MKHHYLPQFYLKRWRNPAHKVVYYTLKNATVTEDEISPEHTGYEKDLYAKVDVPEDQKHDIEINCFKQIDDNAAIAIDKALTGGIDQLDQTQRHDLGRFIISLLVRHAAIVENTKRQSDAVLEDLFNNSTAIEQAIYKEQVDVLRKNFAIETIAAMSSTTNSPLNKYKISNFDEANETLLKMTWWLENFSKLNYTLLTSDHPVSISLLNKPSGASHLRIKDYFLDQDYLLSIPLSPTICFYAHINDRVTFSNTKSLLKTRNLVTLTAAKQFIYAVNRDQRGFVEKNILKNPTLKKYYDEQVNFIKNREESRKAIIKKRAHENQLVQ